jgi:hypothetical protein
MTPADAEQAAELERVKAEWASLLVKADGWRAVAEHLANERDALRAELHQEQHASELALDIVETHCKALIKALEAAPHKDLRHDWLTVDYPLWYDTIRAPLVKS